MQRVRGHDLAFQVNLVQHHRGHRHLVRLLADLSLRGDHRGGGGQGAPCPVPGGPGRLSGAATHVPNGTSTIRRNDN
jgi:hypothetical protein